MDDMPLNEPWRIKPKDWLRKDKKMELPEGFEPARAPLLQTPEVNPELVAQATPNITQTGLTTTEDAWLSNEEKAMRLRQRGQA